MTRVVLGSRNKKKLREMLDLLGDLGLDLTDLTPYPHAPEVAETADTFLGNATLKATQLAPALNAWVIGEDSGLVVPALGGRAGRLLGALRRHARRRRRQQREAARRDGVVHRRPAAPRTTSAPRSSPTRAARLSRPSKGAAMASSSIAARHRRLRLRPALPRPGIRQDLWRTAARGQAVDEPSGAGVRAAGPAISQKVTSH